MKQNIVRVVRSVFPKRAIRLIETTYRRLRIVLLSALYRHPARSLSVIAITGTNGKTTTACYLNEILKQAGLKTAIFTTALIEVNGEKKLNDLNVTVASVLKMQQFFALARRKKVDYVIIEATSHALEQHKLDGIQPEVAIMTNLTQDHLDYHGTMERYAAAKGLLFARRPKFMVLNRDDEWYDFYAKYQPAGQMMTYGAEADSEARIDYVKLYKKGSEASVVVDHQTELQLDTAIPGKFNVYNMTAAATAAYLLGVKTNDISEGVRNLDAVPGRFENMTPSENYDVIVDYAHTPDALEQLLDAASQIAKNRVMLVFGSCGDRDKAKRPIMGEIAATKADRIFLTDEESYNEDPQVIRDQIREGIEKAGGDAKTTEFADRRDAIAKALSVVRRGDIVLITGMGHEQFRIVNGERLPWSDGEVVKEILAAKKPAAKEATTNSDDDADDGASESDET